MNHTLRVATFSEAGLTGLFAFSFFYWYIVPYPKHKLTEVPTYHTDLLLHKIAALRPKVHFSISTAAFAVSHSATAQGVCYTAAHHGMAIRRLQARAKMRIMTSTIHIVDKDPTNGLPLRPILANHPSLTFMRGYEVSRFEDKFTTPRCSPLQTIQLPCSVGLEFAEYV